MNIHYAGQPGNGYGWGVCNTNLRYELHKLGALGGPESEVHFIPIADHNLTPSAPLNGKVNLGYCFFESELGPDAKKNADRFDVVFAGSTWCLDRLKERGVTNGAVLIQGVDHSIFKPGERKPDGQFRIFSGGKFEYRKGQDLVIAAFREFAKTHPDAHLVCSWHNPWPQLIGGMAESQVFDLKQGLKVAESVSAPNQQMLFAAFLASVGLESHQYTVLPQLSQADLAREMQNTDCGLFPNRCEGGTNLVLMEYAACGRRVVANCETGHADVMDSIDNRIPAFGFSDLFWASQSVADIVGALELAYLHRAEAPKPREQWTWEAAARKVVEAAREALRVDLTESTPGERTRA